MEIYNEVSDNVFNNDILNRQKPKLVLPLYSITETTSETNGLMPTEFRLKHP